MYIQNNNKTLSHNHFAWKNNTYSIFWLCVYSLSYSACKAHAPCYIVMWPVVSAIFFHFIS